jgi:TnpA family transposase
MEIERQYVDSHGQSEVAFAFSYILGFDLLPRFKLIARQKLSWSMRMTPSSTRTWNRSWCAPSSGI